MTRHEVIEQLESLLAHCKTMLESGEIWERDCEALDIAIKELKSRQWISVKDKMPPYNQPVIICRPYGKDCLKVEQGCRDLGDWWRVYGTRTKRVTHWMPLPEPTEED